MILKNIKNESDTFVGIGAALAQTAGAYSYFDSLPIKRKWEILEGARGIKSSDEMLNYVKSWFR